LMAAFKKGTKVLMIEDVTSLDAAVAELGA
jgi:hypothetical protein